MEFFREFPPQAGQIVLVLFLSFLIGLEREEHKAAGNGYGFGGVRTFPLIGLIGYALAVVSGPQLLPLTVGFVAVSGFLWLSYWHKLTQAAMAGATTEVSGMATFLVGALVCYGHLWTATALCVASLLLLDLKTALENLAQRIDAWEIRTFAKFLFLSAVVLPILPNQPFGVFRINPFKTWLVVVAISAISYASYVLQKLTKGQGGIVLTALLGGAYSSTATTVALARQSKSEEQPHLFSGGILMACGVMYLRLLILVTLFSRPLAILLWPPFLVLAAGAAVAGWLWTRRCDRKTPALASATGAKNPLELTAALLFGLLFLVILVATQLVIHSFGNNGVYTLAALVGVSDINPFVLSMTQAAGTLTPVQVAAAGITIAAASNNVVNGLYAFSLGSRKTGAYSLALLVALAAAGLASLLWVLR